MVYKVMGKMFAIVGLSEVEHVIVKCDPHLVEVLKMRRYWISLELNAEVPADEIARIVDRSYDLVCETLTRKQRAELAALQ